MGSPSSLTRFLTLLLASASIGSVRALDISFDRIQCDLSLPAYASTDDVRMTCNDGEDTRCSFGQDVMIRGTRKLQPQQIFERLHRKTKRNLTHIFSIRSFHIVVQYNSLNTFSYNGTGYASANLRLFSLEYNLFQDFPISFCGDWIEPYSNTENEGVSCPYLDGFYYFNVPYTLPADDDDLTTWFATGWSGVSSLKVRNSYSDDNTLLADCTMHWHTYVTPSEEDGWKSMPSAAQTGIVLASVLTAILCCCTYMICCKRRNKHITDIGYYDDVGADYKIYDEEIQKQKEKKKRKNKGKIDTMDEVEASRVR